MSINDEGKVTRVIEYRSCSMASHAAAIAENVCEAIVEGSSVRFIGDPGEVHGVLLELQLSGIEGTSIS